MNQDFSPAWRFKTIGRRHYLLLTLLASTVFQNLMWLLDLFASHWVCVGVVVLLPLLVCVWGSFALLRLRDAKWPTWIVIPLFLITLGLPLLVMSLGTKFQHVGIAVWLGFPFHLALASLKKVVTG